MLSTKISILISTLGLVFYSLPTVHPEPFMWSKRPLLQGSKWLKPRLPMPMQFGQKVTGIGAAEDMFGWMGVGERILETGQVINKIHRHTSS